MSEKQHLTTNEAASYLRTGDPDAGLGCERTLSRWRRQGKGPAYVRLPGRIVYRKQDLDAWIAACRVVPVRERGGVQ